MKIDPKYFNTFLVIVAAVAASLIAYFTLSNFSGRQDSFRERIVGTDSLQFERLPMLEGADSLSVSEVAAGSRYVVLDVWAPWAAGLESIHDSLERLRQSMPGRVEIVSAVARDNANEAESFIRGHPKPFHYVQGDRFFTKYRIPGIPLRLLFNPSGTVQAVYFGPVDSVQYRQLAGQIMEQ